MVEAFVPQFFLLIGVDVFLGGSILTVLLDHDFPTGLPYILDVGAFVGFAEILIGPQYVSSFSPTLQFYYCFAYLVIAVSSISGLDLYLFLVRNKAREAAAVAIVATIPSLLVSAYFGGAYVNGLTLNLPYIPVLSINIVYTLFFSGAIILLFSIVLTIPSLKNKVSSLLSGKRYSEK